jgi:hypothetical protein
MRMWVLVTVSLGSFIGGLYSAGHTFQFLQTAELASGVVVGNVREAVID